MDEVIRTDMCFFIYKPEGIQIHSGSDAGCFDAWKLRDGKYIVQMNYEICMEADALIENGVSIFLWHIKK